MNEDRIKKLDAIRPMISNTPLLEIEYKYKGRRRVIFAKAEYYNLTGSLKDRVAYHILRNAYERNRIKPEDVIVEATSGNTGISFCALGRLLGHKVVIYMPDWMTQERINIMTSFGAQVITVSRDEGGFLGAIKKTEDIGRAGGVFLPRQFSNEENTEAHYLTTGVEITEQLASIGRVADCVVAGVGTGGTIMGVGKRLKEANPNCKIYPLEPLNSPTLSTGYKIGMHRIYGISDEFIPPILKMDQTDDIVSVDDGDAIAMARMISETLGIGVGVSSGANFLGCVMAQDKLGDDSTVVTVFADDNKKYLSTDYAKDMTQLNGYISKDVELVGVRAYR
ncbi:MAG: cysteine synthase family protein [Clostridia bacterium]|nr:cysteine synthase family protein [Clostridia bacterium]